VSYSNRRQVYSLGKWVENFKSCNDIKLRVVTSDICAFIGGVEKAPMEDASLVPWLNVQEVGTLKTFHCDPIVIECNFREQFTKCKVLMKYSNGERALVYVDCNNREELMKMCTFFDCGASNRSGSLKLYGGNNKVEVRRGKESIQHYVKVGYPPIYEIELNSVIVDSS
jgi:hypothetical protein